MEKRNAKQLARTGTYFTFADTGTSIFFPNRKRSIETKAQILRRYFALHAILYDYVIVLDSSLFHNPTLEYLSRGHKPFFSINPLLERGFVVPALRYPCEDFQQLFDYFKTRRDRSLEWWGSRLYAKFLESRLLYVLPWDSEPLRERFGNLFSEGLREQNNSYFVNSKLPDRLLKRLSSRMRSEYERKGYVPRGTISQEYLRDEYKGYRKPLKLLSDHIYYALTANLFGVDSSFHATISQKNYIQIKLTSTQERNRQSTLPILHEASYEDIKGISFRTFMLSPKFWDHLNFEQLLAAKEKLRKAEYGTYLINLTKVLSGDIQLKNLESLVDSLKEYLKELEALILNQPGRSAYENLREEYYAYLKREKRSSYLISALDLVLGVEPLMNLFTTVHKILKSKGNTKLKKLAEKEELRSQLSLTLSSKFPSIPLKVSIDAILGKKRIRFKETNKGIQL